MKTNRHHYLHFTKKERSGIIMIVVVVVMLTAVSFLYPFIFSKKESGKIYKKEIAQLNAYEADSSDGLVHDDGSAGFYRRPSSSYKRSPAENLRAPLFYFDPNMLSLEDWQKLGVKEKTAAGIRHYIEKGGKFRQAGDIEKIWGLSPEMKERLLPYIRIPPAESKIYERRERVSYEKKTYEKKIVSIVDINTADTTDFIGLPGIGSKLAQRIIAFREKLGGFYAIDQVGETFGLPDSVFQKIKLRLQIAAGNLRKININTATPEELKGHPYIRWQLGNAIVQYRQQHGNFSSVDQLKNIAIIKEDILLKISPYLKVSE